MNRKAAIAAGSLALVVFLLGLGVGRATTASASSTALHVNLVAERRDTGDLFLVFQTRPGTQARLSLSGCADGGPDVITTHADTRGFFSYEITGISCGLDGTLAVRAQSGSEVTSAIFHVGPF